MKAGPPPLGSNILPWGRNSRNFSQLVSWSFDSHSHRDSGSHLRFRVGAVPTAIRVEGDERVVFFNDWVILKFRTFGYGFERESISFGGWMGASSNGREIEIGPDGMPVPKERNRPMQQVTPRDKSNLTRIDASGSRPSSK